MAPFVRPFHDADGRARDPSPGTAGAEERFASVMRLPLLLCLTASFMGGCERFPRDPEGTLQRVQKQRAFRVGIVSPLEERGPYPEARELLQRVATSSGARARIERGEAEQLLDRLEQGHLDLVLGHFEKKSPWATLVTFGPPLRVERRGKTTFHLTAAMRNGENEWIALVEREARSVAADPQ